MGNPLIFVALMLAYGALGCLVWLWLRFVWALLCLAWGAVWRQR